MNTIIFAFLLFNSLLLVFAGIFIWLLREEAEKLAAILHIPLPTTISGFLRLSALASLFSLIGLLTLLFLHPLIF